MNRKEILDKNSFYTISVIGQGSYAKVILVKKKDSGQYYAMKVLKKQKISKKKQEFHVKTERDILVRHTDHPFLVKLFYSFQNEQKLYFILEYCPGGELFNLLSKQRKFSEDQARFYACQLVLALEHLHKHNIIYRDLKPENVLINYDGYIKLADFGLSKIEVDQGQATTICGTPEYLAPEIVLKQPYGKTVDWWTLGSIIYEMIVGIPPFYCQNRMELFHRIKNCQPTYPKHMSSSTKKFLEQLLEKDPAKRLGFNGAGEIKNHSWFENVNWDFILQKKYESFYVPQIKGDLGLKNFEEEFRELTPFSIDPDQGPYKNFDGFTYEGDDVIKQRPQKESNLMEIEEEDQFNFN